MKKYFLEAEKGERTSINLEDKNLVKKLNKFFIGESNKQRYYLFGNRVFSTVRVPSGDWYQDYLVFLGQKEDIIPSLIEEYFNTQNILNKLGYFDNNYILPYHFVKKARKDYPEEGIKKGDSYYWTKKDRFSEKKRFKEKPL